MCADERWMFRELYARDPSCTLHSAYLFPNTETGSCKLGLTLNITLTVLALKVRVKIKERNRR